MENTLQRLLAQPALANDLDACPRCEGSAEAGWVCEEHPGKPWRHAGCSAAGEPCVCNVSGAMLWAMVYSDALRPPERSAL